MVFYLKTINLELGTAQPCKIVIDLTNCSVADDPEQLHGPGSPRLGGDAPAPSKPAGNRGGHPKGRRAAQAQVPCISQSTVYACSERCNIFN